MSLKFTSAGSISSISRQILFSFLVSFLLISCKTETPRKDSEIVELRKTVEQLSEENRALLKELQELRKAIQTENQQTIPAPEPEPPAAELTIDQVKKEVEPVLTEVIEKIKKTAETPRKEKQYGMRVEYDLKNAVYGLMNTEAGTQPAAKVIVKYERFLESGQDSRSYGTGNSTFVFAQYNGTWVLQSYE